ncbi:hypothetical protein [Mycobacterium sp. Marseille-P9652]|uniref:hypothetical protein n=1 Tax=Mycobacterium sp. Marseille-P9652 TaxID=2654950 RepID=UPI0012E8E6DC|nr:hypothetical protein [Mycobacterium sp. Marseille-P9652]
MLIIALVLALIGLVALVFAVVTSNELVAWVCIGASVLGVILLIIDAVRERQRRDAGDEPHDEAEAHDEGHEDDQVAYDYPEETEGEASEEAPPAGEEPTAVADTHGDEPAK